MSRPTILVVEDDTAIRRGLVDALQFAHYDVIECADGNSGLQTALGADLDLVLLDVILPGADGFEILEQIRATRPTLPVIMVTARGTEDDRVHGLQGGADDYVVKPFSARELLARVEAVMRRTPARPVDVLEILVAGLTVNVERREVTSGTGETHGLSEKEAEILAYLARNTGRAVTREELLQRVWGLDPQRLETRTVDMHIARLRDKLSFGSDTEPVIITVRGKGYMLSEAAETRT